MKVFSFTDIQKMHIPPEQCYAWVENMILHKSEALLPPKTHMNLEGNVFCNVMPCIIQTGENRYGGVKVVTRYPKRIPALDSKILLFHADTGDFLALMDADWITAMRTGAVATHSVIHLAKQDFCKVGFIGLGNTARATMLILATETGKELQIKLLRYKDQAEQFIDRFAEYPNLHFSIEDDVEHVIKGSDVVISCATYFAEDICSRECFDEGVLVVPVHTRGFTNCDLFFDKVFADDRNHVCDFRNFAKFKSFAEMCDVVNGKAKGREDDRERILAYNIGIAVHDIGFASKIYQLATDNPAFFQSLQNIDLFEPTNKFWV